MADSRPFARALDRRQVLAAAAWSVPVIAGMAAIPAAVASGEPEGTTQLFINHSSVWREGGQGWTVLTGASGNLAVKVDWSSPEQVVTEVTVRISVPVSAGFLAQAPTVGGSGWTAGTGVISEDRVIYTFLWAGTLSTTGTLQTSNLDFTLPAGNTPFSSLAFPIPVDFRATGTGGITAVSSAQLG